MTLNVLVKDYDDLQRKYIMEDRFQEPLISIIIPVYKTEKYLSQCFDSLINQTYQNLEFIVIDDASPDNSGAICDSYAEKDARFHVIHKNKNEGVSAARNDGLDIANGKYISFVDSDDWVESEFCRTLSQIVEKHGVDVGICGWFIHDRPDGRMHGGEEGANRVLSSKEALYNMINSGHSFEGYLWNKMFKAELFKESINGNPCIRLQPEYSICEDLLLVTILFALGKTAYYLPKRLYHYRYRKESALRTFDKKRESEYAARTRVINICEAMDDSRKLSAIAKLAYVKSALTNLSVAIESGNRVTARSLRGFINNYMPLLAFHVSLPVYERFKLLVRWLFPVLSMRLWNRSQKSS